MKNITFTENPSFDFFGGMGETIKTFISLEVQRRMSEFMEEYEKLQKYKHSTINSNDLCKRWGRSKNSLRDLEKRGIVQPLLVGGKTKIYSMEDVLNAEMSGKLKRVG